MLDLPFNHTVTIIIITVIVSMLAFSKQELMNRLIFWPPAMQRGQYEPLHYPWFCACRWCAFAVQYDYPVFLWQHY